MTTQPQTSRDGDSYDHEPVLRLGQGDYERVWPDPHATIDLDERPGSGGDGPLGLAITLVGYFAAGLIVGAILF